MKQHIFLQRSLLLSALVLLSACSGEEEGAMGAEGPQEYRVMEITSAPVDLYTDYAASLKGKEDIEIRPKIDGYIDAVLVDEGQQVRKGQVLFRISNPQYEQEVRNAQAAVEVAEAGVDNARLQVEKTQPLVNKDIVGSYGLKTAQIELKSKEATLMQARATLANARANVGYLTISSPFDGIVGSLPHKLGSYVSTGTQEPLTVVSNIRTIYAYFSVNEKQQLEFFRTSAGSSVQEKINGIEPVQLILADGSVYEDAGKVETISGQVNPSTGSFSVRAAFANEAGLLRSGNSGKIRIFTSLDQAILIPQNATYELQGKRFVYVLTPENTVRAVEIRIREVPGGQLYVVDEGLKPGDTIVIEGVRTLREGAKIIPKKVNTRDVVSLPETEK